MHIFVVKKKKVTRIKFGATLILPDYIPTLTHKLIIFQQKKKNH